MLFVIYFYIISNTNNIIMSTKNNTNIIELKALDKIKLIVKEEFTSSNSDFILPIIGFIENKIKASNNKVFSIKKKVSQNKFISFEAQVAFLIDFGIELKTQDDCEDIFLENYNCIDFYGVKYLIEIKDYMDRQGVCDYLVTNNSISGFNSQIA